MNYTIFLAAVIIMLTCCRDDNNTVITESSLNTDDVTIERNPTKNAYYGDLHIHTSWSFDAFIYNNRTSPDDAYRFGKGERISYPAGEIKNKYPLDFMAVTDHSEYMGVMKQMIDPEHPYYQLPLAENVRSKDRPTSFKAFSIIGRSLSRNNPIDQIMDVDIRKSTWKRIQEAADRHNDPGKFTTFYAYEFTSSPNDSVQMDGYSSIYAKNLHRNVIYKSGKASEIPFSSLDSQNPEDLWDWMDKERAKGIELMAIPHNGNMSSGMMYAMTQYDGSPMTRKYIEQRLRNEPIQEVVQVKGSSMSHPILNSNDEFANFELFEFTFTLDKEVPSEPDGSYVRKAMVDGLKIEQNLGANPYKFGLIGSSDGHNSAGATEEDNYFGKFGARDGTPEGRLEEGNAFLRNRKMSAAGLAGVWAESNTRDDIYSALENKETFATSGSRISVRFFGGVDSDFKMDDNKWVQRAYDNATPMGTDMNPSENQRELRFAISCTKDPNGANLDRVQIIKASISKGGNVQENIYNALWSDKRKISKDGKLTPVGNTVDIPSATYTNTIGATHLQGVWTDPDFDPKEKAFYYVRVLEIPTPRWSTYDAQKLGIDVPKDLPSSIQERAWSSPIWYNPN